jgi:hypothetical protein
MLNLGLLEPHLPVGDHPKAKDLRMETDLRLAYPASIVLRLRPHAGQSALVCHPISAHARDETQARGYGN